MSDLLSHPFQFLHIYFNNYIFNFSKFYLILFKSRWLFLTVSYYLCDYFCGSVLCFFINISPLSVCIQHLILFRCEVLGGGI